jgi:hypothetical protein
MRVIKSRMMRWMGYIAGMGRMRKPEEERALVRPRSRWENNIMGGCELDSSGSG